ncbi:MAG TPA: type I-U CRISPR-associated helicase/endonuclease Cas3 [Xanthobacteraceae bacterium]|nr:type I-U CRISPR-associated helicase/endonuclease Cas3 [Xanthobacteraceae bacterium]
MDGDTSFEKSFRQLAGNSPMSWQARLFAEHFARADIPSALDIPTGLGKTSVMAIWLIARALTEEGTRTMLPRRLVYVVDRRAVVDQATSEAEKLRENLEGEARYVKDLLGLGNRKLPISTLRGAHVDNREWLDDPSVPAIIVGTVDMIGSRILFGGYGVGPRMRPYHAGLLGADALIVLDEAHLVPPFQALIEQVGRQAAADRRRTAPLFEIPAFRTMALSATGRDTRGAVFKLQDRDVEHDKTARQRIEAPKSIAVKESSADLANQLAERAWELSDQRNRVVVFCNSRKVAGDVFEELEDRLKKLLGKEAAKPGEHLELIVGARRVRERELLADTAIFRRFARLPPKDGKSQSPGPGFLVATSAGEVGVDVDADHMVCDLVAWERMVQRLGRVNRRGEFASGSLIDVFVAIPDKEAENTTGVPATEDCRAPFDASGWPKRDGRLDASLRTLRTLRDSAEFRRLTDQATTDAPLHPVLTSQELAAWSMTSLSVHPGRPEKLEPWIRGWIDEEAELPQSEVLWRRYLPIRGDEDRRQAERELTAFFEAAPPHISETLETETHRVVDMLRARVKTLLRRLRDAASVDRDESARDGIAALTGQTIVAVVLNRDRSIETLLTLNEIEGRNGDQLRRLLANRRVVLDARLGGLAASGLLDPKEDEAPATIDGEHVATIGEEGGTSLWSEQRLRESGLGFRVRVTRRVGGEEEWKVAYRRFVDAGSEEADDASEREEWRVEEWVGEGAAENELALAKVTQKLDWHRDRVVYHAERIAVNLNLPHDLRTMLVIAARYHDSGKARRIWQRFAGNNGFVRDRTSALGKFAGWADPRLLKVGDDIGGTYRHEFGSLHDAMDDKAFDGLPSPLQRLGLRLIAAHHGSARPSIFAYDEDRAADRSVELAQQIAIDFGTLQSEWGAWGLAWWEALLRAADVAASREKMA